MPTELPLTIVHLLGLPLLGPAGIHMALGSTLPTVARLVGLCLAPPAVLLEHALVVSLWPGLAQASVTSNI